ncbi:hypothetical protein [Desulfobacula sp.]|uniref:hypothetical protein n=1 Tax=Desulfobacula sp. TaxID=2593537 RepID=UPI002613E4DB|nr:hypothetical protein [Desulfobacula sp.]
MLKENDPLPKTIAWNGIALNVPLTWEIDSLDTTHLLIGEDGSPKVEIKWTDSPSRFTLETYLKRFISQSQKRLTIKIHELPTPRSFSHPEKNFEFFFFSWTSTSSTGNGVLIFCSLCKRLTMIRFFSDSRIDPPSLPALILMSFTDHPPSDQTHWQVFDLKFSTPRSFELLEYSFKPGCYIINVKHKKTIQTIFSWGPASFLLTRTSLSEFASQRLPQLKGLANTGVCIRGNYLEWSYRPARFKNAQILPFLSRYSLFTVFRICHDQKKNRILGVMVDSPLRFEHDLIKGSMIGDL